MASSPLNPKRLKVVLTSLREAVASLEASSPSSPSPPSSAADRAFRLLLVAELASRGAGVGGLPEDGDEGCAGWTAALLESIGGVAGKVAIDDAGSGGGGGGGGGYPPPMMAALNAAAGMAAAACRASLDGVAADGADGDAAVPSLLPLGDKAVRKAVEDTMKRCLEVDDGRFYALLKLAHDVYAESKDNDETASAEKRRERRKMLMYQLKHHFSTIAYSNYLYGAANFAKDQPPMWKRCLDAALENTKLSSAIAADSSAPNASSNTREGSGTIDYKSYQNSQTILPLQNMIRIAKSKGNEKRARDLSLFLSVGYLGGVQERLGRMQKESSESSSSSPSADKNGKEEEGKGPKLDKLSTEQLLQSYFLHRTSTLVEMEDSNTCQTLLDSAQASLAMCDPPKEDDVGLENYESWLLHHYVEFQLGHLAEEANIWAEVQRRHRAMLNRRPEGGDQGAGKGGGGGGIGISSKKSSSKSLGATATAPTATTKEEMERRARSEAYLEKWNAWKMEASSDLGSLSPVAMRGAVVALSALSPPPTTSDIVRDCHGALSRQADRLVEMAAAVAQQRGKGKKGGTSEDVQQIWQAVLRFVSPLMKDYLHPLVVAERNVGNAALLTIALRRLAERSSEAIVSASWMCEPNNGAGDLSSVSQLLPMAHECLMACQMERSAEEKRILEAKKGEASVLSSRDGHSAAQKEELLQFQCALAATKCREELRKALPNGDESALSSSALAAAARGAASKSAPPAPAGSRFGAPYLRFLSAWSGTHRAPWPFCTLGQARAMVRDARDARSAAGKAWGRRESSVAERAMLDAGEADLEGGLAGGSGEVAEELYSRAMAALEEESRTMDARAKGTVKVHCLLGLSRISLSRASGDGVANAVSAEALAREALDALSSLDPGRICDEKPVLLCLYPWSIPSFDRLSHAYHVCAARQLVAEACLRSSRPEDARVFLADAVKDLPGNYEAAFALASFHLRLMVGNDGNNRSEAKKTRTLLLKAAKMGMDTVAKPDPFALLGVWYESQKDASRAKGCYQKALAIDPSHPVAGRGFLRLPATGPEEQRLRTPCEDAAKQNSPFNGWAWRVMGQRNTRGGDGGDDAAAAVCFQQALRCRDIQSSGNDALGTFYRDPASTSATSNKQQCCEASETWTELAACYRRMGKYSAALRAYEAAYIVSDGNLSPNALCAWAQVDLDLGLYEEAAEKCDKVMSLSESSPEIQRMTAYIEGEALLFLAKKDIQEGKFGASLSHLEKGISRLSAMQFKENSSADSYFCEVKLLGDLYSSGNSLPSYVFSRASAAEDGECERKMGHLPLEIENQLLFMMKGEEAYKFALELGKDGNEDDEDTKCVIAAAKTDIGSNLLSQARVVSMALGEGSGGGTKTSLSDLTMQSSQIKDLITRSINSYLSAVDTSPHEAPAWCGLGCALIGVDPLLSQHAFSRALQIDPSLADSWSQISLLYANVDTEKCSEILDYLTQVEDTPLMWIGRGFLLEKTAREWKDQDAAREGCLTKAADAYRAALQIMQHPAALLGLSLTCRGADPGVQKSNNLVYSSLADRASKLESRMSLAIHQNMTGGCNIGASYVSGLTQVEEGLNRLRACDGSGGLDLVTEAVAALNRGSISPENQLGGGSEMAQCEIDLSASVSLHSKQTAGFPYDLIRNAADQASSVSSNKYPDDVGHVKHLCDEVDEARNLVHLNPESGEAWLIFAQRLAQDLTFETRDVATLQSAKTAAKRAYDLLHERVVNATLVSPRRQASPGKSIEYSDKSVVSSLPSASLLSESMSLMTWLEELETKTGPSSSVPEKNLALLQESLMLDPTNPIATALLAL